MNINQHPFSKFSNCHNFLFHPLYEKKRAAVAIAAHLILSAFTLGLWQIPFWIVNCLDRKWSANPKIHSKLKSLSTETFDKLSAATPKIPTPKAASTHQSESSKKNSDDAQDSSSTQTPAASLTKAASPKKVSQPTVQKIVPTQSPAVTPATKSFAKLSSLPKGDWMEPADPIPFIFGITMIPYVSSITQVGSVYLDSFLLDQPLKGFLNPTFTQAMNPTILVKRYDQVKLIKARVAQLNQAIQLEDRCKKLGYPPLTLRDIMVAWEESPLKYALMMDDELLELKASDVPNPSSFKHTVSTRVQQLAQNRKMSVDQDALTVSSIQEMLVVDMPHLSGKTFNRLGKDIPAIAFAVISPITIPELEMTSLTKQQQKVFFYEEARVHKLTNAQVNSCVKTIKLKFLSKLSDDQIHNLDFSQINKDIFEAIFLQHAARTKKLLQDYELPRIYEICQYFKDHHWRSLSDEQIHALDFAYIDDKIFKAIFVPHSARTKELLQGYELKRIYEICDYFTDIHWGYLSDKQIHDLDFAKIDDKIFKVIFVPHSARTKELLQGYELAKIYEICKYFTDIHWGYLSDKQIHDLDFAKIDDKIFAVIFKQYEPRTRNLLKSYDLDRIYEICKYFKDYHWKCLSDKRILDFDFKKIDEKIFQVIFELYSKETENLLQQMSDGQIIALKPFLKPQWHKYLSDHQKKLIL